MPGVTPGFLAVAARLQKLAEAATAMSQSDVRRRVQDALSDAFRGAGGYGYLYAYVVDIFGDDKGGDVVYSYNDDLKKATYTIAGTTCTIDTAAAVDVQPLTTYETESPELTEALRTREAGARNSKRDLTQLQTIHDASAALGATCKMAEARRDTPGLKLVESAEALESIVIKEAKADYQIKLIAPGKGSSAFYPAEVLKRDGPKVFRANTHVYLNHATLAEEAQRPEGDVKNLAGVLTTDAVYHEAHASGPGLYARIKVFADHAAMVEEKAPHVGMSIRASGVREAGKTQDGLPVLKELTSADSVDVVTRAGAGGMILTESRRIADQEEEEDDDPMTPVEATEVKNLRESTARLLDRAIRGDARVAAAEVLEGLTLAEAAKKRVVETVCAGALPKTEAGELDRTAFAAVVAAEAKREGAYVARLVGSGRVSGMGAAPAAVELTEAQRTEADARRKRDEDDAVRIFESFPGMTKEAAAVAAKGRAA